VRLGIDLGTTRTIVAACDRGNYPVVGFSTDEGDLLEHVPTMSAELDGRLVHGHVAEAAARAGAPHLRSWKRLLGRVGPEHRVCIGSLQLSLLELATDYLAALAIALRERSNLPGKLSERPETVVSVPANAHSSQRFITLEAFRAAGFDVRAMINEPSAAAIEYAHRYRGSLNSKRDHVAVYDLGGGTFDAALVSLADGHHDVIDTAGIQQLGSDDFDEVLLSMALEELDLTLAADAPERPALLDECRSAKEGIGTNTRRVVLELSALGERAPDAPLTLSVPAFYERLQPLVERSIKALASVMSPGSGAADVADMKQRAADAGIAGIYVVGGGSGLPIVPRQLREHFSRRMHRSPYPAAAAAMGLAIAAESEPGSRLSERFTRHLGVFREREAGQRIVFDRIFARGTPMPRAGEPPLVATREYQAAHNIGWFRFVECATLGDDDEPFGDISPHGTVLFPFAPHMRERELETVPIERVGQQGPRIEERYEVDAAGVVAVTISDLDDGYRRRFLLGSPG
jgi:molecular chaperone DnaK (HSP70)